LSGFQLCNGRTQANATFAGVAKPKFSFIVSSMMREFRIQSHQTGVISVELAFIPDCWCVD